MNLPDTHNANYQYAFKKGYRMAMEGKPLSNMPSNIRYEVKMREYFQQGWQTYQDELAVAEEEKESPWRSRFAWLIMAILAGVGTAAQIITEIEDTRQQTPQILDPVEAIQQPKIETIRLDETNQVSQPQPAFAVDDSLSLISSAEEQTVKSNEKVANPEATLLVKKQPPVPPPAPKKNVEAIKEQPLGLSLLSDAERSDLQLNKKEQVQPELQPLPELVSSNIEFPVATFSNEIVDRSAQQQFDDLVPKYVRKLYFFTQVSGAKGKTLYHRWWHKGQIMATIPLKIKSDLYRTWSSKRLSSAWAGRWTVDILDEDQQVIYRKQFDYIKETNNEMD